MRLQYVIPGLRRKAYTNKLAKSKKWHCIDYVITKKDYWRRCLDVSVIHGAGCNSDHQLMMTKLS